MLENVNVHLPNRKCIVISSCQLPSFILLNLSVTVMSSLPERSACGWSIQHPWSWKRQACLLIWRHSGGKGWAKISLKFKLCCTHQKFLKSTWCLMRLWGAIISNTSRLNLNESDPDWRRISESRPDLKCVYFKNFRWYAKAKGMYLSVKLHFHCHASWPLSKRQLQMSDQSKQCTWLYLKS